MYVRLGQLVVTGLMICCICIVMSGCGSSSGTKTPTPTPTNNPAPTVTSLSPASSTAGAATQTLTINGTNFISSSAVTFNAVSHTATFVSATQLTISLTATDQVAAGNYSVIVTNPTPGGGASSAVKFTVNNPVPTVTSISPASVSAGAAAQTLTVTGTNFVAGSTVTLGGTAVTATIVSSTQLTIPLTAANQTTPGNFAVVVTNAAPGGGSSATVNFEVSGPVLAGTVYKGASVGSLVTAYEVNADGSNGSAIGTATTDSNGNFSVSLTALPPGAVRLTATGGSYASEFDATTVTGTSGISALLDTVTANVSGIVITPASDFINSNAAWLLNTKAVADEPTAHTKASTLIVGYLGLSSKAVIELLTPVFDKPDITANPDAFKLGLFIGSLATEGKTVSPSSPDDLIAALSSDISDGVFDGKNGTTAVPLASAVESKIRMRQSLTTGKLAAASTSTGNLSPTAGTTDFLLSLGTYITTGSAITKAGIALADVSTVESAIFGGVSACTCTPSSVGLLASSSGATTTYSLAGRQYLILAARQEGVAVVDITDPTTKTPPINAWPSISSTVFGGNEVGGVIAITGLTGHPQVLAYAYASSTITVLNLDTLITGNPATDNPVDLTAPLTLKATNAVGFSGGSAFIAGGIPDNGRGGIWLDTADGYGLLSLSSLTSGATSLSLSTLYPVEDTTESIAENVGGDIGNNQLLGGNYGGIQLVELGKGKSYYLPSSSISTTLPNFVSAQFVDSNSVDTNLRVGILTSEDDNSVGFLNVATSTETDSTTTGTLNALAPASGGLVQVILGTSGGYFSFGPDIDGVAVDSTSHLALFMNGYSTDIAVGMLQDPSKVAQGASWTGLSDWSYFTLTNSPELADYALSGDPHSVGVIVNQTTGTPYGYVFDGSTDRGVVQIDLTNFLALKRAGTTGDAAHQPGVDPGASTSTTGGLVLQEFIWTDPTTPITTIKKLTPEDEPIHPTFTPNKQ